MKYLTLLILFFSAYVYADDVQVFNYIKDYPALSQKKMRDAWLKTYKQGQWQFTGQMTAKDRTVVSPQAEVNYGYSWFNISERPIVVTMPRYKHYYSISVFDMDHYMDVIVRPDRPTVVRLPNQKSPIKGKYNEIVLNTNWGLIFTRQQIVNNEKEVMSLAKKIRISGGKSDKDFIVQNYSKDVQEDAMEIIKEYSYKQTNARNVFCSRYEGCSDMDRAAGVFLGQLGTQSYVADYQQYMKDQNNDELDGDDSYQITFPGRDYGVRNKNGYFSVTVYNLKDRYLIPNEKNTYFISSTTAKANKDGSITVNINPDGIGVNGIPTKGKDFYAVTRFYEPKKNLKFPPIKKVSRELASESN